MTIEDRLVLLWLGQLAMPADQVAVQRVRRAVRSRLDAGVPVAAVAGELVASAWSGSETFDVRPGRLYAESDRVAVPVAPGGVGSPPARWQPVLNRRARSGFDVRVERSLDDRRQGRFLHFGFGARAHEEALRKPPGCLDAFVRAR